MIRVGIETATRHGSVAVARDDRLLAEVTLGVQSRHAEGVLPALEAALGLAGLARRDIGAVVVGAGPGSFTGVRVAGATAKGLVAGLGVPLLAYPSLLALAVEGAGGASADAAVCGLFDARRGEVYAGCWRVGVAGAAGAGTGGLEEVLAPRVGVVAEVVAALDRGSRIEDRDRGRDRGRGSGSGSGSGIEGGSGGEVGGRLVAPVVFVGEGVARYRGELEGAIAETGLDATLAGLTARPRASGLLWLAHHHGDAGAVADPTAWEPAYVRGSGAERGVQG